MITLFSNNLELRLEKKHFPLSLAMTPHFLFYIYFKIAFDKKKNRKDTQVNMTNAQQKKIRNFAIPSKFKFDKAKMTCSIYIIHV